jgi:hypothetical protein
MRRAARQLIASVTLGTFGLALWMWVLLGAALDQAMAQKIMNSITSATAFATLTTGFRIRLDSGTSTAAAAGTEITGSGYTAGGQTSSAPFATTATLASPSVVTIPHTAVLTWTNGSGSGWSIQSLDLNDGAGTPVRTMFGNWNGAPIAVANGNTFQVALDAISAQGS